MAVDPPIEPVYPIESLLLIGRIGGLSVAAARKGIAAITRRVREKLDRYHTERLFSRPKGVPATWIRQPSKKGDGVKYIDPKSKGHTDIRIQKGDPNSPNLGQQKNYVKWKKNGQWLDKNGNPVSGESLDSHIYIKDFTFNRDLFK
ncbi:MAG: hypothetical protein EAY65_03025 [Alphaproteobacteria bacterium]|nr:MAG: hypothetical protein EAY65_03025 [Alphaproteobacteria bacterium]